MVNLLRIFVITAILFSSACLSEAGVINRAPGGKSDAFIAIAENMSYDGVITGSSLDNEPMLEARLISKLPPGSVIKLYQSFLEQNDVSDREIERFSEKEPVWKWCGEVSGEEKQLTISYVPKENITLIEIISYEEDKFNIATISERHSFLSSMKKYLVSSKENYLEGNLSAVYVYQYPDSIENAISRVRFALEAEGWESMFAENGIKSDGGKVLIMQKGAQRAGIVGTSDKDGTVLTIIFHGGSQNA